MLRALVQTLETPTTYVLALKLAQEHLPPPALEVARSAMQQR